MAVSIDQYVVRFDISMNETHIVDAFDGAYQLGQVESARKNDTND